MVVSPNGLGHLRRVTGVLDRLHALAPQLHTTVVAEPWQVEAFAGDAIAGPVLAAVEVRSGVTEPGVRWHPTQPHLYDDGRLLAWEDRLAALPEVAEADLVISDNLAGTLAVRPDAVLMGSFLGSDVLDAAFGDRPEVAAFVQHERSLLARHRPAMLCVADLAMPGVLERSRPVRLPWMCPPRPDDPPDRRGGPPAVAVSVGRTGAGDDLARNAVRALLDAGYEVAAPARLHDAAPGGRPVADFDHSAGAFGRVDVVVGRPGLGLLHDCVAHRVPVVAVHEGSNLELEHNAARVGQLGLGIDAGTDPDPVAIVAAVEELTSGPSAHRVRSAMAALATDGLDRAASWITERMGLGVRRVPSWREASR